MSSGTPQPHRLHRDLIEGRLLELYTCFPGIVDRYDSASQTATIRPLFKRINLRGEEEEPPQISKVPVIWPAAGDWLITWKLKKGDNVLCLVSQRALEIWQKSDGSKPLDPAEDRHHDVSDAIAIPGLHTDRNAIKDPGDDLWITHKNGNPSIQLKAGGDIRIDGGNIILNGGTKGAHRIGDREKSDGTTDPTFWAWFAAMAAIMHPQVAAAATALGVPTPSLPTSLTSKAEDGSSTVKIG